MNRSVVVGSAFALTLAAFLARRYSNESNHADRTFAAHLLYYVDPMHLLYRSTNLD